MSELDATRKQEIGASGATSQTTAQDAVSQILSDAIDIGHAAPEILRAIGEIFDWGLGALWIVNRESGILQCIATWHAASIETTEFEEVSKHTVFPKGTGLPGHVWATEEATWVPALDRNENFPRLPLALKAGLRSALVFPIQVGATILGVVEFFSHTVHPPGAAVLQAVTTLGQQIGQFVERTYVEQALRESDAHTEAVLQSALDAVVSIDHRGQITEFNPAAERMFGYTRNEVIGQQMAEMIVPPDLRDAHYAGLSRYLTTGEGTVIGRRIEVSAIRRDGDEFPVELAITRVPVPGLPRFTGYLRDLTERKQAETRQRFLTEAGVILASSIDYETTLERVARLAVPFLADWCLVYLQQTNGSIERVAMESTNPSADDIVRTIREGSTINPDASQGVPEVIRSGVSLLYPDASASLLAADVDHPDLLESILEPLGIRSWMCVPLSARGRTFGAISFVSTRPMRRYDDADLQTAGDLAHRAALAVENARLYREVREALRVREEFISIAAHELRTPLTTVKAYAQLLGREIGREPFRIEQVARLYNDLQGQIGRFEILVADLLDASRMQQSHLQLRRERIDLVALTSHILERFEHDPSRSDGHTLVLDAPQTMPGEWDPDRLDQVITNLVSNALKYSPQGGEVRVRLRQQDNDVELTVSDQGIGIAPEEQEQVFQPFTRGAAARVGIPGSGLGLYITKEIVERHGGIIHMQSEPGHGTTFTVHLPALDL